MFKNEFKNSFGKVKNYARKLKKEVMGLNLPCKRKVVPQYAKALDALVAGYALNPIDLILDFIPILGYLEEMIIVPLGTLVVKTYTF